jgi:tripartite-type tricarboxylate transporter receptor subunit TctC
MIPSRVTQEARMPRHLTALNRRTLCAAIAAAAWPGAQAQAQAQSPAPWPDKPQRWVVPFPAGGVLDVLTRTIAQALQGKPEATVVVENPAGAAGNLGIQAVARAAGDGSNWLFVPQGNITINASLMPNTPFKWERDFKPVTLLAYAPNVMVVHPSVPAQTVSEFISLAKSKPGQLSYASPGVGSSLHLTGELLKREAGIDLLHVPYKGTTQALQDAIGGQVQVLFGAVPTLLAAIQSGKLRALAVTSAQRSDTLPAVPTLMESGISIDVPSWYGVMAPASTPAAHIERAQTALAAAMAQPTVREKLLALGLRPVGSKPADFAAQIQRETAVWARVIREAGIKAE